MEMKPNKLQSASTVKAQLINDRFQKDNEPIPTILEKSTKSLGCWYDSQLKDLEQAQQLKQDSIGGFQF